MQTKKQKGSALVYALIMLSIMIVIAVGSFSASVIDQKTSNDTTKSVSAFQAADTGVEKVLNAINDKIDSGGGSLVKLSEVTGLCNSGYVHTETDAATGAKLTVSFYKVDDSPITDCSLATLEEIDYIKSVGEFGGTVRAVAVSVEGPEVDPCGGEASVDYAGKNYPTVAIGDQCWLRKNLDVGINQAPTDPFDYNNIQKYCYSNNIANCNTYGGLYTWAEANGLNSGCNLASCAATVPNPNRGICPAGWHIPTDAEWYELEAYYATGVCDPARNGAWGCNFAGQETRTVAVDKFSALRGGTRTSLGMWQLLGEASYFWSSSESAAGSAWHRYANNTWPNGIWRGALTKRWATSVRCIKDQL